MTLRQLIMKALEFGNIDDEINVRILKLNKRGTADTVKLVPITRITSFEPYHITILEHDIEQAASTRA